MSQPPARDALPSHIPAPGLGLAAACLSLFVYATALFITPALNSEIARSWGATLAMLGRLPTALMLGFVLGVVVVGRIGDRWGKVPVMTAGNLLVAAGVVLFALSADFTQALAANVVVGFGGGLSETAALALVSDLYEDARRTSMANLSQAMFSFGAVASPLAVGWMLASGTDWRAGYLGVAVLCVAAALLSLAAAFRGLGLGHPVDPESAGPSTGPGAPSWRTPGLALFCLGAALYVGAEIGQSTWLSMLLERDLGAAPAPAAAGLSLLWLGLGVGRLAAGIVARRMSDRMLLRWALVLATVLEGTLLLAPGPVSALAAAFGLGLCLGPIFPTLVSAATSARPDRSGAITAFAVAAGALGGAIVPASIGWVADRVGLHLGLGICVALLAVNTGLFLRPGQDSRRVEPG